MDFISLLKGVGFNAKGINQLKGYEMIESL